MLYICDTFKLHSVLTKRTIDAQITAVRQAINDVPKTQTQTYQQDSLQAALKTLEWVRANRAVILEVNRTITNEPE